MRIFANVVGKARDQQRVLEARAAAHADRAASERRAFAACGGEHLVADGIVDRAGGHHAPDLDSDRDGEERVVVREVGGAVERVEDPAHVRSAGAGVRAGLLRHHRVSGEGLGDALQQTFLRTAVVLGDEIRASLVLGDVLHAVAGEHDGAGLASEAHGGFAQNRGGEFVHAWAGPGTRPSATGGAVEAEA